MRRWSALLDRDQRIGALGLLLLFVLGAAVEAGAVAVLPALADAVIGAPPRTLPGELAAKAASRLPGLPARAAGLVACAGLVVSVFTLKASLLALVLHRESAFVAGLQARLLARLFSSFVDAPYDEVLTRSTPDLLRTLSESVSLTIGVVIAALRLVLEALVLVAILTVLTTVEPLVTACSALFSLVMGAALYGALRERVSAQGAVQHRAYAQMIRSTVEASGLFKVMRVQGLERWAEARFLAHAATYLDASRRYLLLTSVPRFALELLAVGGFCAIAVVAALREGGPAAGGVLSVFAAAALRLAPSTTRIAASLTTIRHGRAAVQSLLDELERPRTMPSGAETRPTAHAAPCAVVFEGVGYRYPSAERDAIEELTLTIPAGALVGLCGTTGAGKTTVVDLLLGLLSPTRGRVLVDGVEASRRASSMAYVPQEVFLLDDTLGANVTLDRAAAPAPEVRSALEEAQLEAFVREHAAGLATPVGERGVSLSGGERQRVAIARALFRRPALLVLDEATSAMDQATERALLETIQRLKGQRTVVMVSHRLRPLEVCDTIFFMEQGRLVASGTYEELLSSSPRFRRMAVGP